MPRRYKPKDLIQRQCEECGKWFGTKREDARQCSGRCRAAASLRAKMAAEYERGKRDAINELSAVLSTGERPEFETVGREYLKKYRRESRRRQRAAKRTAKTQAAADAV